VRKIPVDEHEYGWTQLSLLPSNLSTWTLTVVADGCSGTAQVLCQVARGAQDEPVSMEGHTQVPLADVESLCLVMLLDVVDRELRDLMPF